MKKVALLRILLIIPLFMVSMILNGVYAYAGVNPSKKEIVEKIVEVFPDAPIMIAIAMCESELRQYEGGKPLRNEEGSTATGLFQIVASAHMEDAKKLGHKIGTLDGNIKFARVLYDQKKTKPWKSSRSCWKNRDPEEIIAMVNS